jgi:hypothetical protein
MSSSKARRAQVRQPTLQGVARGDLLVVLGVDVGPGGGHPQGAGELKGLGLTARRAPRQRHTCLLDLLVLRGGGLLMVYFGTPNMFITHWFGFD